MNSAHEVGGAPFAHMIGSVRLLQDRVVAASNMPTDVIEGLAADLDAMIATLEKYEGSEAEQWTTRRPDLPSHGGILIPPYFIDRETSTASYGRVTFTRFYLGGGAAAHGGTQPLLFDDALGALIHRVRGGQATRTAYLKVDYRKITPLDVELILEAKIDRIEGRKAFASGRILDHHGNVLCEADALFLVLLPGQP